MNTTRVIAVAQLTLSFCFLLAYAAVFAMFLTGAVYVAPVWRDQIGVMLGVLTGGVTTILGFWFARQRPQEPPHEQSK